jgi:hypothetical protein
MQQQFGASPDLVRRERNDLVIPNRPFGRRVVGIDHAISAGRHV